MKKRILSMVLFIVITLTMFPYIAFALSVPNAWAVQEVNMAINAGLVTTDVTVDYQANITRKQFCEMVVLAYQDISGTQAIVGNSSFNDTDDSEILKAANLGIVSGYGNGVFGPSDLITREQIAAMLVRMIDKAVDYEDINIYNSNTFSDSNLISDWALPFVNFAFDNNIMHGVGDNRIDPKANTTCEESILLVYRVVELYSNVFSKEDFTDIFDIDEQIKAAVDKYTDKSGNINIADINSAIKAVETEVKKMKSRGDINMYTSDNNTVWMKLNNGLQYVYIPQIEGFDLGGTSMSITTYQPFNTWYGLERPDSEDQERGILATDGSASKIADSLLDYEFINNYDDAAVSIDNIKKLGDNQFVLWHGHGGYNSTIHSFIATGEELDETKFLLDPIYYLKHAKYTNDYIAGRIVCTSLGRLAITDKFIDKYISSMNNSFVYIGACESGKDSNFTNSLLNKGAVAVIGNSDTICTEYNQKMMLSVCDGLLMKSDNDKYFTLNEALNYAFKVNGENDILYDDEAVGAYPVIFGDNTMVLENIMASDLTYSTEKIAINQYSYEGIIKCCSGDSVIWEFRGEPSIETELSGVSDAYIDNEYVYFITSGTLYAFNKYNGDILWSVNDVGASNSLVFDDDYVYVCGYYGPNLMVVSKTGRIVYVNNDYDYGWAHDLHLNGNNIIVSCGMYENGEEEVELIVPKPVVPEILSTKKGAVNDALLSCIGKTKREINESLGRYDSVEYIEGGEYPMYCNATVSMYYPNWENQPDFAYFTINPDSNLDDTCHHFIAKVYQLFPEMNRWECTIKDLESVLGNYDVIDDLDSDFYPVIRYFFKYNGYDLLVISAYPLTDYSEPLADFYVNPYITNIYVFKDNN